VVDEVVAVTATDSTIVVEAVGTDVATTTALAPVAMAAIAKREATEVVAIVTMALVSTATPHPVMIGTAEAVEKDVTTTKGTITVPLPQLQVPMLNLPAAPRSTRADLTKIVPMTGTPVVERLR